MRDCEGRRNYALLAVLVGCGPRRAEVAALRCEDFQFREGHCVIADLMGKGGHIRTVPVPDWVKLLPLDLRGQPLASPLRVSQCVFVCHLDDWIFLALLRLLLGPSVGASSPS